MSLHPEGVLDVGAAVLYLLASVGYGAHLLLRQPALANIGRAAGWGAVLLQTGAIGVHCAATGRTPFTTPAETLMASAWAIALLYLVLELILRPRPFALGAFALPAAFLCLFGGSVLGERATTGTVSAVTAHALNARVVSLHVVALLFAFSLLTLAFGAALLYLTQHSLLKRRGGRGGLWGKLPPLASLEQTAFVLVAFAFPLLTIGLAGGRRARGGGRSSGGLGVRPENAGVRCDVGRVWRLSASASDGGRAGTTCVLPAAGRDAGRARDLPGADRRASFRLINVPPTFCWIVFLCITDATGCCPQGGERHGV